MRNLLTVVAMLSVFLFGIGTAHAVLGVNDAVPGEDVVFPMICGATAGNQLNTVWAVAEKNDGIFIPTYLDPLGNSNDVACTFLTVYDKNSNYVYDTIQCWTKYDVVPFDCKSFVGLMSTSQKDQIKETINAGAGTQTVYMGYVVYSGQIAMDGGSDRFIPWIYLVDLNKGFASAFNGVSSEMGVGQELGEDHDKAPVTAASLYPRYNFLNNKPDTWNWWFVLAGRNEYAYIDPYNWNMHRRLDCNFCNEEELCISIPVPIPHELNIINVLDYLPAALHAGFPKNGFAMCTIAEGGLLSGPGTIFGKPAEILGTRDEPTLTPPTVNGYYSIYGWSYQRAAGDSVAASWDVIHEMHREYCDLCVQSGVACTARLANDTDLGLGLYLNYVTGDTTEVCTCSGSGCL